MRFIPNSFCGRLACTLVGLALFSSAFPCAAVDVTVQLIDGKTVDGKLLAVDSEAIVIQTSSDASSKIASDQVMAIVNRNPGKDTRGSHQMKMVDGSLISVDSFESVDSKMNSRFMGSEVSFSRRNIEWVLFDANTRVDSTRQKFQEITEKELKNGDRLVVLRNQNLDWLDGVIGDSTEEKTQFKLGDRNAGVARGKIAGLIFYHASGRELVDPICQMNGIDGSKWQVKNLKVEGDQFEITMVGGDVQKLPANLFQNLDFASGRFAFLSQLKPSSVRWEPLLASASTVELLKNLNQPRFNQSFHSKALSLFIQKTSKNGLKSTIKKVFDQGWAARSGTRIVFSIGKQYSRLSGKVGFAPTVGRSGDLKLIIRGDGKVLFEKQLKSSDASVLDLNLEIEEVDRLIFEIDYLDGRSVDDELHFCDMKVSK